MRGEVGLDVEGRSARICTEGPNFGRDRRRGRAVRRRDVDNRAAPLGRVVAARWPQARSSCGHGVKRPTAMTHAGTAVTWNRS
jgi:hypothetical protein